MVYLHLIHQKIPPDSIILDNWVFDNFVLANEAFAKALRGFETYVLVNNNLYGLFSLLELLVLLELFSLLESPTAFNERFKVTSVPFFTWDFNLLNYEFDNFTFTVLYWVISNCIKRK